MQQRGTRLAILSLLLVIGALSGFFIWTTERGIQQLDEQRLFTAATVDRLLSSISTVSQVQQAYIEGRRHDVSSFTRVSVLIDRIPTDAAGLRAVGGSDASNGPLEDFWTALSALMGTASRARDQFASGDEAGAFEAILAGGREHTSRMNSSLRAFNEAEAESYGRAQARAHWWLAAALITTTALWALALVLFAVIRPRAALARDPVSTRDAMSIAPPMPAASPATAVTIDPWSVARLSVAVARLSDQGELPELLGRAGEILDARGVVIWMGAGSELFAAAAHGYDQATLQRVRPIARNADNATAAAWRTGEMQTVPADSGGYGAIVAPLLGPTGCVGVLAVETRSGRENDAATQAAALIVASQLSGVLAAWPTASAPDTVLDRQAAAS